jgi:hypothetical protein
MVSGFISKRDIMETIKGQDLKKEVKNKSGKAYCSMYLDKSNDCNYVQWEGFSSVEDVKLALEEALKLIQGNGCPKIINDTTKSTGPWSGANEWIVTNWSPRALAAGLRKSALILSPNVFSAMSAQQLEEKHDLNGLEFSSFKDKDSALGWFNS